MNLHIRVVSACLVCIASALHIPALAEPKGKWPTTERPLPDIDKQGPLKALSYGLCDGPQNADAFASSPVPVEAEKCHNSQTFSATSANASYGGTCGGFTVALGPKGDLKPYLDHVTLRADWGDTALTSANCAKARVAAVGWGARCTNDACTTAQWEKIGGPTQRKGYWNTTSQVCYIEVGFNSSGKKFKTLSLDIIAKVVENGQTVRKRAKGTIRASHPNGKCLSTTVPTKEKR
jgi:hypothetical protein